jgi:hypothetical protein
MAGNIQRPPGREMAGTLPRRKPSRARPALPLQLTPTTKVRYEVALRRQILPRWELVPLSRITHSDVSSWVHGLTDEGLAPATVRYAHRVLSLALTAAIRDGRLVRNVGGGRTPSPALWPRRSAHS